MKYKGIELVEITEPQICNPPKKMVVWNYKEGHPVDIRELPVIAILPRLQTHANIVCKDGNFEWWATSCAEIPEEPKPRRATNRELAEWLAKGNGQKSGNNGIACVSYSYGHLTDDCEIDKNVVVRKWGDTDWHEPTVDYMRLEEYK